MSWKLLLDKVCLQSNSEVKMSTQTIRILIAGALFVHGVGHTLGFFKIPRPGFLFNIPEPTLRLVSGIVWTLTAVGFIIASMSFYGIVLPADWWRPVAVIFAVISLIGLFLFGRTWPIFNFIGASALNIAVLVALLWIHWPPLEMFNR
jgi:hypothetical protein